MKQMIKKIQVVVLIIIFISNLSAHAYAAEDQDAPLVFLGNQNLEPIVFNEDHKPKGIVVDIVYALAERMGQPIDIKAMDWAEAQEVMLNGEADALIQINRTEEREQVYDFSDDLLESKFSIFTRSHVVGINDKNDLRGKKVGVEANGFPELMLSKEPDINVVKMKSIKNGFEDLQNGLIDAIVVDEWVGAYIVASNRMTGISIVGKPLALSYSSIAVTKGNKELLGAINLGLSQMKEDGSYQEILAKWQPKEIVIRTREQIEISQFRLWITILAAVILFIVGWMLTLYRQLIKVRKVKQELSIEHSRLTDILISTNAGTWEWNFLTGEININSRYAQISGYELEDFTPFTIEIRKALTFPEDELKSEELINKLFKGELEFFHLELRTKQKDGRWRWVLDHGRIVKWRADGTPLLMYGTRYDISDRKKSEIELVKAMHKAEAANIAKSQFLANISHEIRTPMNGVIGMIELLQMTEMNSKQQEYLDICKSSSFSLLRVINDILEYSKIEARRTKLDKIKFNFNDLISETVSLHKPSMIKKGIDFNITIEDGIPTVLIGDLNKLRQVLTNIIGNAIKYTDHGNILLHVKKAEETQKQVTLEWLIEDTGIGISPDNLENIFNSFNQADNTNTRKYGGTGLGLSICKGLIDLMQGEIWVESKLKEGSRFYFTCIFDKEEASVENQSE